jgi:hypothetical protein
MGSLHTLAGLRLGDAVGVADGPAARAADDLAGARVRAAVRGRPRPERARRRRARAGPGGRKRDRCAHSTHGGTHGDTHDSARAIEHRSVWSVDGGRGYSRVLAGTRGVIHQDTIRQLSDTLRNFGALLGSTEGY